jgi:hypothetical protein
MSKFGGYAMAKYDFRFCLAWLPKKFFSWGVEIRYHVANFDTLIGFAKKTSSHQFRVLNSTLFKVLKKSRDANEALDASNASLRLF